jgi:hypothetical protein
LSDAAFRGIGDDGDVGNAINAAPSADPSAVSWSFFDPMDDGSSNKNEPAAVGATPKRLCHDRPSTPTTVASANGNGIAAS